MRDDAVLRRALPLGRGLGRLLVWLQGFLVIAAMNWKFMLLSVHTSRVAMVSQTRISDVHDSNQN